MIRIFITTGKTNQKNNGVIEKYCYNNNPGNCTTYGGLYQWDELMDYSTGENAQGICPEGWHVPGSNDFAALGAALGGDMVAGGKMKEAGTAHWVDPNTGATNSSGFAALPAGYRWNFDGGTFHNIGNSADFWTSTVNNPGNSWNWGVYYMWEFLGKATSDQRDGLSVRCIKNGGVR